MLRCDRRRHRGRANDFMINSDGVLSFKFSPDYETPLGGSGGRF